MSGGCLHPGDLDTDAEGNRVCRACESVIYAAHAARAAQQRTEERTRKRPPSEDPGNRRNTIPGRGRSDERKDQR